MVIMAWGGIDGGMGVIWGDNGRRGKFDGGRGSLMVGGGWRGLWRPIIGGEV